MTAGRLRHLTNKVWPISPVRFVLEDGTELEYIGRYTAGPPATTDGKPTGVPSVVFVLKPVEPSEPT